MQEDLIVILRSVSVASYIGLIDSLKRVPRRIGGNAMRHSFAVFGLLLDYEIYDSVTLKTGLCHDLLEDHPDRFWNYEEIKKQIYNADEEGPLVLERVEEITIRLGETKEQYLQRLMNTPFERVKLVKGCDRISNFTDLNTDFTNIEKIKDTISQTQDMVIPMLQSVKKKYKKQADFMIIELNDLINNRLSIIQKFENHHQEINI